MRFRFVIKREPKMFLFFKIKVILWKNLHCQGMVSYRRQYEYEFTVV